MTHLNIQGDALIDFIDWVLKKKDVYFVTATQALLWITDPVPVSELEGFEPWQCKKEDLPPKACKVPNSCSLVHQEEGVKSVRYMTTCRNCPSVYPWLGNASGDDSETIDIYEKFTNEE